MNASARYAALFGVFAPLSIATIGGGQAVIADIQRQVVDVHHWMSATQFVNDFAIARMAPGPGSLLATLIGWQVAGFWGAVIATLALFGPTAFLIYGVAHLWRRHRGARWQIALEAGLRPVAAGMILASVWVLLQALDGGWPARAIAVASTLCVIYTRVHALLLIAIGALLLVGVHALGGA
ncbi:chromate transporter [Burkholderia sp. MSMB1826]|uniref:chromate transporter n=1 Tax=Burkholderia sp. MSMB1826 TaxID=1637875 RepID=UPI000757F20F|nr:chromate transporter [Burkholderia sp. MSMB1826]KVL17031.1 chromate transporter [Burkholderia sp. MSMB1826]